MHTAPLRKRAERHDGALRLARVWPVQREGRQMRRLIRSAWARWQWWLYRRRNWTKAGDIIIEDDLDDPPAVHA